MPFVIERILNLLLELIGRLFGVVNVVLACVIRNIHLVQIAVGFLGFNGNRSRIIHAAKVFLQTSLQHINLPLIHCHGLVVVVIQLTIIVLHFSAFNLIKPILACADIVLELLHCLINPCPDVTNILEYWVVGETIGIAQRNQESIAIVFQYPLVACNECVFLSFRGIEFGIVPACAFISGDISTPTKSLVPFSATHEVMVELVEICGAAVIGLQ